MTILSNLFDKGGSFLTKRETWTPPPDLLAIQVLQQIRSVSSTDFINTIALYPIGPETSSYTLILRAAHHRGSSPSVLILVAGIDLLPVA